MAGATEAFVRLRGKIPSTPYLEEKGRRINISSESVSTLLRRTTKPRAIISNEDLGFTYIPIITIIGNSEALFHARSPQHQSPTP